MRFLLPLFLLLLPKLASAENAQEIITRHQKATLTELKAYLDANPAAPDKAVALDEIIAIQNGLGDTASSLEILQARYDEILKTKPVSMEDLFMKAVQPTLAILVEVEDGAKGSAFIEKLRKDIADHEEFEMVKPLLDHFASLFDKPGVGKKMEIRGQLWGSGKEFNIEELKGKYVLVDFWATWCGPCVAEIPNIKKAYAAYKDKGFEIVGISLDEDKDELKKFIEDKELTYPMLLDSEEGHGFAEKYGVVAIPSLFLLDKEGVIIATNLRGPALERKLQELLP